MTIIGNTDTQKLVMEVNLRRICGKETRYLHTEDAVLQVIGSMTKLQERK